MKPIIKKSFPFIVAILFSWFTSIWLLPLAALERGYTGAYGGEWILIFIILVATYWAISEVFDH